MWTDRILNLNNKLELSQCGVNYVIIFTLQCLRNQTPFKTYHVWCDVHVGRAQCFWQQLFSNHHWLWMHRYKRQHTCRGSIHKGHLNAVLCKVKQVFGLLWTITVRSNILEYLFFFNSAADSLHCYLQKLLMLLLPLPGLMFWSMKTFSSPLASIRPACGEQDDHQLTDLDYFQSITSNRASRYSHLWPWSLGLRNRCLA